MYSKNYWYCKSGPFTYCNYCIASDFSFHSSFPLLHCILYRFVCSHLILPSFNFFFLFFCQCSTDCVMRHKILTSDCDKPSINYSNTGHHSWTSNCPVLLLVNYWDIPWWVITRPLNIRKRLRTIVESGLAVYFFQENHRHFDSDSIQCENESYKFVCFSINAQYYTCVLYYQGLYSLYVWSFKSKVMWLCTVF